MALEKETRKTPLNTTGEINIKRVKFSLPSIAIESPKVKSFTRVQCIVQPGGNEEGSGDAATDAFVKQGSKEESSGGTITSTKHPTQTS